MNNTLEATRQHVEEVFTRGVTDDSLMLLGMGLHQDTVLKSPTRHFDFSLASENGIIEPKQSFGRATFHLSLRHVDGDVQSTMVKKLRRRLQEICKEFARVRVTTDFSDYSRLDRMSYTKAKVRVNFTINAEVPFMYSIRWWA